MKLIDILNKNYWGHNHNVSHFDPSDLSFTSVQKDAEHVDYFVSMANGKRIGVFNLWNGADTVYVWSELKAPDKAHILKLMGIIPVIVKDYMDKRYYPEGTFPDDFNINLDSPIKSKRFNELDYFYYTVNVLGPDYRVSRKSDTFKIMPIKPPKNQSAVD